MQTVTIGKNQAGQRFDKFLQKHLPQTTSSFIYKMLRKKNITLNDKKAEGKELLAIGDKVSFFFAEETYAKFTSQGEDFTAIYKKAYKQFGQIPVIYEDEHVLILNKPSGILSQKAEKEDSSINEWMIGYLLQTGGITESELQSFKPSVCNRLDRNTSGLLLCGKTLSGSQELSKLIRERSVSKYYRLLVKGLVEKECVLKGFFSKDEKTNKVTVYKEELPETSYIETAYHPIKNFSEFTYLEVELITGKTHQIRAHLSSIGHPLIGDYKYGDEKVNQYYKSTYGIKSQMLHAYRLEFPTLSGALAALSNQVILADIPDTFLKLIN